MGELADNDNDLDDDDRKTQAIMEEIERKKVEKMIREIEATDGAGAFGACIS